MLRVVKENSVGTTCRHVAADDDVVDELTMVLSTSLITGGLRLVTGVVMISTFSEGHSSGRSLRPLELQKCSLHTRELLFRGRFLQPILRIHFLNNAEFLKGKLW